MAGQRHQLTTAQRRQVRTAFGTLGGSLRLKLKLPHCRLLAVDMKIRQLAKAKVRLAIPEDHAVTLCVVLEMVVKPCLGAQTLEKLKVRFPVLRTEIKGRVIATQLKAPIIAGNAMLPEYLAEDLRHRAGTEDSLAETLGKACQLRPQPHAAKPCSRTLVTLDEFVQMSMNSVARWPEVQVDRLVQQAGKIKRRVIYQQIHIERKRLVDGFFTGKGQDFEGVGQACYIQTK
jgi:hypothetical protein